MASRPLKKVGLRSWLPTVLILVCVGLVLWELGRNVVHNRPVAISEIEASPVGLPDSLTDSGEADPELGEFGVRPK